MAELHLAFDDTDSMSIAEYAETLNDAAIQRMDLDDFQGLAIALETEEACEEPGFKQGGHRFAFDPDIDRELEELIEQALQVA
jgi:hypothetical protein